MFVHEEFSNEKQNDKSKLEELYHIYKKLTDSKEELTDRFEKLLHNYKTELEKLMGDDLFEDASEQEIDSNDTNPNYKRSNAYSVHENDKEEFVCLHDHKFRFLHISPKLLNILGYKQDELDQLSAVSFIHQDDLVAMFKEYILSNRNKFQTEYVIRIRKKNGSYVKLKTTIKQITGTFEYLRLFQSRSIILK